MKNLRFALAGRRIAASASAADATLLKSVSCDGTAWARTCSFKVPASGFRHLTFEKGGHPVVRLGPQAGAPTRARLRGEALQAA